MKFGFALVLSAAGTLVLSGCWPFEYKKVEKPRPPGGAETHTGDAASGDGEENKKKEGEPRIGSGGLPEMALKPVGPPSGKEPKTPDEIVTALGSKKLGERILGLVAAMRSRPPEALGALRRMVRRDEAYAPGAVEVLALYPEPAGSRALVEALDSPYPGARTLAAMRLGGYVVMAGGRIEKSLVRTLSRDSDIRTRVAAARALSYGADGKYGLAAAKALNAAMDNPKEDERVRLECAAALARTPGNAEGWDYLASVASAPEGDRAIRALELAAEVGGERGAGILAGALSSDRTELWTNAARLFALVERESALGVLSTRLRGGGEGSRRAALALAPFEGAKLVPELVKAMDEGSQVVRQAACGALAAAGGINTAPALERKLLDAREASHVRAAAASALGAVGGPGSAPALRRVIEKDSDPVARAAAKNALELIQARLAAGGASASADPYEIERAAFARWALVAPEASGGAKLRSWNGEVQSYRLGDEVALGYHLSRVLAAGEEPSAPEALLAGPEAADTEMVRAILVKDGRSVVIAAPGVIRTGR